MGHKTPNIDGPQLSEVLIQIPDSLLLPAVSQPVHPFDHTLDTI